MPETRHSECTDWRWYQVPKDDRGAILEHCTGLVWGRTLEASKSWYGDWDDKGVASEHREGLRHKWRARSL